MSRQRLVLYLDLQYGYELTVPRLRRIEQDAVKKRMADIVCLCKALDIPISKMADCDDYQFEGTKWEKV